MGFSLEEMWKRSSSLDNDPIDKAQHIFKIFYIQVHVNEIWIYDELTNIPFWSMQVNISIYKYVI